MTDITRAQKGDCKIMSCQSMIQYIIEHSKCNEVQLNHHQHLKYSSYFGNDSISKYDKVKKKNYNNNNFQI